MTKFLIVSHSRFCNTSKLRSAFEELGIAPETKIVHEKMESILTLFILILSIPATDQQVSTRYHFRRSAVHFTRMRRKRKHNPHIKTKVSLDTAKCI